MGKNPFYKPYTIKKGKYEPLNYSIYDKMGDSYIPLVKLDKDVKIKGSKELINYVNDKAILREILKSL